MRKAMQARRTCRRLADRDVPGFMLRMSGLCFALAGLLIAGCADADGGDEARRLLERAVAAARERGLMSVPVGSAAGGVMIRLHAGEWDPLGNPADLAEQAARVTMARAEGGAEAVLSVELKPEAAKALMIRRLDAELEAVRRQGLLLAENGRDVAGRIDRRIDEAKREAAAALEAADVATVVRLRVDRRTAVPASVSVETRIVRPAEPLSAAGSGALPDDGTSGWQETIIDEFQIIGEGEKDG